MGNNLKYLTFLTMAQLMGGGYVYGKTNYSNIEEIRSGPVIQKSAIESQMKAKGMKKFMMDGHEIWAINMKNARKKYEKIIKQQNISENGNSNNN